MSRPILHSDMSRWGVIEADALKFLPQLPGQSVDAVVTDPPYGINFGGEVWDGQQMRALTGGRTSGVSGPEAFEHFTYLWAVEVLRVLKPGGHLLAFGAPRTVHRMVSALEDVGFEVRDQLLWLYASGVPKSRRYPDGLGSALKPAYEPIVLARKPLEKATLKANTKKHGTGLLQTEAAAVIEETAKGPLKRWPANVVYSHAPDCDLLPCKPGCPGFEMDISSPNGTPVSRIFYATKASSMERETGLDGLPRKTVQIMRHNGTPKPRANVHQTVKPVALMRWLTRMGCPGGGVVLDPFTGSGSTGIAAVLEGRQFIGIEREAQYVRIAKRRIRHWLARDPEVIA